MSENFLFDEPKRSIRLGEELKFSQPERAISGPSAILQLILKVICRAGNYAAAGDFSLELSFDRSKESG